MARKTTQGHTLNHSGRNKKLTAVLRARLMPHEKELLTGVAEETGATLSQWSRKVLLEAAGAWQDRAQIGGCNLDKPKKNENG